MFPDRQDPVGVSWPQKQGGEQGLSAVSCGGSDERTVLGGGVGGWLGGMQNAFQGGGRLAGTVGSQSVAAAGLTHNAPEFGSMRLLEANTTSTTTTGAQARVSTSPPRWEYLMRGAYRPGWRRIAQRWRPPSPLFPPFHLRLIDPRFSWGSGQTNAPGPPMSRRA